MKLAADSDHLLHLDVLRFIAAVGIVAYHAISFTTLSTGETGLRLFVDLFFVISGFVIAFVYGDRLSTFSDWRAFMLRRIARLGPLHWLTLTFMAALAVMAGAVGVSVGSPQVYDLGCFAPNALFLHAGGVCPTLTFNVPSWSISAEMAMYATAPALLWVSRRPIVTGVVLVGLYAALFALYGASWTEWTAQGGMIRALPSFILGAALYAHRDALPRTRLGGPITLLSLTGLVATVYMGGPDTLALGLVYLAVIGAVMADRHGGGVLVRRMAPLGQLTYSSYMLHVPILTVLASDPVVAMLGLSGSATNLLVLCAFLIVWPLSWLSYFFFETPARRWITRLRPKANRHSGIPGSSDA